MYSFGYDSEPVFSKSVATIRSFSKQLLHLLLSHSQAVSFSQRIMDGPLTVPKGQASANDLRLPQPRRSSRQTSKELSIYHYKS